MPFAQFDRFGVRMQTLAERENKKFIDQDHVAADQPPGPLSGASKEMIAECADRIRAARRNDRPHSRFGFIDGRGRRSRGRRAVESGRAEDRRGVGAQSEGKAALHPRHLGATAWAGVCEAAGRQ